MNRFVIIIPFYNAQKYIERCLMSALSQKHKEFSVVIINDASTDDSDNIVKSVLSNFDESHYVYIVNKSRKGAMYNHQFAALNLTAYNDIIVHLDGDDYLPNKKVLSFIDSVYSEGDCLLMYGQYTRETGGHGTSKPFESEESYNNLRELPFVFSHIRTFRSGLFHEIKEQDSDLNCFKNKEGQWFDVSCDVAMMTPLLEIAGYDRIKFNDTSLYIYNDTNPISDFRTKLMKQESTERYIRGQKPFLKMK